jgi:hypothetical protein
MYKEKRDRGKKSIEKIKWEYKKHSTQKDVKKNGRKTRRSQRKQLTKKSRFVFLGKMMPE